MLRYQQFYAPLLLPCQDKCQHRRRQILSWHHYEGCLESPWELQGSMDHTMGIVGLELSRLRLWCLGFGILLPMWEKQSGAVYSKNNVHITSFWTHLSLNYVHDLAEKILMKSLPERALRVDFKAGFVLWSKTRPLRGNTAELVSGSGRSYLRCKSFHIKAESRANVCQPQCRWDQRITSGSVEGVLWGKCGWGRVAAVC